eukprot:2920312-Ditylum_brightwellii.AAC.1
MQQAPHPVLPPSAVDPQTQASIYKSKKNNWAKALCSSKSGAPLLCPKKSELLGFFSLKRRPSLIDAKLLMHHLGSLPT